MVQRHSASHLILRVINLNVSVLLSFSHSRRQTHSGSGKLVLKKIHSLLSFPLLFWFVLAPSEQGDDF